MGHAEFPFFLASIRATLMNCSHSGMAQPRLSSFTRASAALMAKAARSFGARGPFSPFFSPLPELLRLQAFDNIRGAWFARRLPPPPPPQLAKAGKKKGNYVG